MIFLMRVNNKMDLLVDGKLFVGSHVGKDPEGFYETVQKIKKIGGNTLQIFIGSPQKTGFPEIELGDAKKTREWLQKNRVPMLSHAKYLINLASEKAYAHWAYSMELKNIWKLGGFGSIVHTGNSKQVGVERGLNLMEENIKKVIKKVFYNGSESKEVLRDRRRNLRIIIETSAGCGNQMLCDIDDLGDFYRKRFSKKERKLIYFGIDTCHIFAAGYDIRTQEGAYNFLDKWNKKIGLKKVCVLHLNDSKDPLGSNKDHHEMLGEGYITNKKKGGGLEGIAEFVIIAKRVGASIITERGGDGGTKKEIKLIKSLI